MNARSCAPLTMQRPAGTGSWLKSWVGLLARVGKGERVGERNARWAGSADTKEYGVCMIRLMILRIRCAAADQTSRKTWQHKPDEIYCTVDVHKIKGAPRKGRTWARPNWERTLLIIKIWCYDRKRLSTIRPPAEPRDPLKTLPAMVATILTCG